MELEKHTPAPGPSSDIFSQDNAIGQVTVSVGPYVEQLPLAGRTVGEIRAKFKKRFDIDDRSQAIIDGTEVDKDTIVQQNQVLMFVHKSGEKGVHGYTTHH